jgi:hypothetical protein
MSYSMLENGVCTAIFNLYIRKISEPNVLFRLIGSNYFFGPAQGRVVWNKWTSREVEVFPAKERAYVVYITVDNADNPV